LEHRKTQVLRVPTSDTGIAPNPTPQKHIQTARTEETVAERLLERKVKICGLAFLSISETGWANQPSGG
jgi:hypothetical protein